MTQEMTSINILSRKELKEVLDHLFKMRKLFIDYSDCLNGIDAMIFKIRDVYDKAK